MYQFITKISKDQKPWLIPVEEKIKIVKDAVRKGKKIALAFCRYTEESSLRYMCYNVMRFTQRSEKWQLMYFYKDEYERALPLLSEASLCIFARMAWCYETDTVMEEARKLSIPVVYQVDDDVVNIQRVKPLINTLALSPTEGTINDWFCWISRYQAIAEQCDGFITTNEYLKNRLSSYSNKHATIIRNTVNAEQVKISEEILKVKERKKSQKPFTIGYFSGSPSHINDFKTIAREIDQLLRDYPEMHLKILGFLQVPSYMNDLVADGRITNEPLVEFIELQKHMAEVDVNIAPLVENGFTNCKSELKFFEAALVKTPTIASPIYTYRTSIQDGVTGYLCEPGQWYDRIVELYKNPEKAKQMANKAYHYCMERYYGAEVVAEIEAAYDYFAKK